jgi:hypothetical protein
VNCLTREYLKGGYLRDADPQNTKETDMRKMLVAAVVATMFVVVAPAFANPSQEAVEGYAGWKAARDAAVQQVETRHGQTIYRSNPSGR